MGHLINTLESPGGFDAAATLRPGEPYFLLVGRDRLAPPLVQQWADASRKRALEEHREGAITDEQRDLELEKATQAEAIGWAMTAYKAGHVAKKLAEGNSAAPTTYTGHELPEATKRRDQIASARARAAQALETAIGEVHELAELLGITPVDQGPTGPDCAAYVTELRSMADWVRPPRPMFRK